VTKEQFDGLLKALDRLGLGMDDGDAAHKPQLIRNDTLLMSAVLDFFIQTCI
jgi:hypothetical protein